MYQAQLFPEKKFKLLQIQKYLKYLIKKIELKIKVKTQLSTQDLEKYDKIILTAYSSNSSILKSLKQPHNVTESMN